MGTPEISVVIPTIGRWALLDRAVRCALEQAGPRIEVIVALDTPGGHESMSEIAALKEAGVYLVRSEHRGVSHARNAAVAAAQGEWIAFLDDDDVWAPTKLARQLRAARESIDFVYGAAVVVTAELEPLETLMPPAASALPALLLEHSAIPAGASNILVRRSVVHECGGFDPNFSHLADWDLWIRLASSARGCAVSDVLVAHVRHSDSMLFQGGSLRKEFSRLAAKHAAYASRLGKEFDQRHLLAWLQSRHEAAGHRVRAQLFRLRRILAHGAHPSSQHGGTAPPVSRPGWLSCC